MTRPAQSTPETNQTSQTGAVFAWLALRAASVAMALLLSACVVNPVPTPAVSQNKSLSLQDAAAKDAAGADTSSGGGTNNLADAATSGPEPDSVDPAGDVTSIDVEDATD